MQWTENYTTWDLKTGQYVRHIKFDDTKLILLYHRIYENMFSIDGIQTIDGTNIINLVRDRVIERLENILQRESNEI
jgi:hypothetical protein